MNTPHIPAIPSLTAEDLTPLWPNLRGVVFDAFSTLVFKTFRTKSIERLMDMALPEHATRLKQTIIIEPHSWKDWCATLNLDPTHPSILALEQDFLYDITCVDTRAEAKAFWPFVAQSGKKLGLCSNIAQPYIKACQKALPGPIDAYTWSCHANAAKPDKAIYDDIARNLDLPHDAILFVGDRMLEDVAGPRLAGMHSMLVGDFERFAQQQSSPFS